MPDLRTTVHNWRDGLRLMNDYVNRIADMVVNCFAGTQNLRTEVHHLQCQIVVLERLMFRDDPVLEEKYRWMLKELWASPDGKAKVEATNKRLGEKFSSYLEH